MIQLPLSISYLRRCVLLMPQAEVILLLQLLTHVCEQQCLLPLDRTAIVNLVHANSRDQQRSLDRVLAQHFDITEDGRIPRLGVLVLSNSPRLQPATDVPGRDGPVNFASTPTSHQRHAQAQLPGVTVDTGHVARQNRYRAEVATLRAKVLDMGLSPRKTAGKKELQDMLSVTQSVTPVLTGASTPRPSRAGAHAGNTNTNTNTEYKEREKSVTLSANSTQGGSAVLAMKAAGMPSGNPSSPRLTRLLDAGVTPEQLADATRECLIAHKPVAFNYILAMVEGERRDAAAKAAVEAQQPRGLEKWGGPELMAALKRSIP